MIHELRVDSYEAGRPHIFPCDPFLLRLGDVNLSGKPLY